jgi:hypothetical protein
MSKPVTIEGKSEQHCIKVGQSVTSCGVTFSVKSIKNNQVSIVVISPHQIIVDKIA